MNTWSGGRIRALTQAEHREWNAEHYPGTRQLCSVCEQPTGRCYEDQLLSDKGEPLCKGCHEVQDEQVD